jgi:hypothetical protein
MRSAPLRRVPTRPARDLSGVLQQEHLLRHLYATAKRRERSPLRTLSRPLRLVDGERPLV